VTLDVTHGSIQQPDHNPVTVQTCRSQNHFLPYMNDATAHDIITTPTEARGHTDTTGSPRARHVLASHCGASVIVQCMYHISSCLHKVLSRSVLCF